jgi:hypothetical protein
VSELVAEETTVDVALEVTDDCCVVVGVLWIVEDAVVVTDDVAVVVALDDLVFDAVVLCVEVIDVVTDDCIVEVNDVVMEETADDD